MQLVFIHGPPAVGKLTVALRLGQATGYPVLHNHLVVDLVQAVFDFGSAPFVGLREAIWLQVVERAAQEGRAGLISTFTPEQTVSSDFIDALVVAVGNAGARALFVQLTCPEGELERRMENESRAEFGKLRSRESYRRLRTCLQSLQD